jgi:YHS domain-containing protein
MIRISLKTTTYAVAVTLVALMLIIFSQYAHAVDPVNSTIFGVAIKGYDTVAYHTEGRAVKGSRKFSYKWNDAEWHFINSENRDLFASDPERYAPQYGGY